MSIRLNGYSPFSKMPYTGLHLNIDVFNLIPLYHKVWDICDVGDHELHVILYHFLKICLQPFYHDIYS